MRSLFLSEKRCISNLMLEKWGVTLNSAPVVLKEYVWNPFGSERRPVFNSDFSLDFVEDFTVWPNRAGTMNSVLPNTLGAEVYLYIDEKTLSPLHFELMSGAAFSMRHYSPYIDRVHSALKEAITSASKVTDGLLEQGPVADLSQDFLDRIDVQTSACARILVVGNDVCFLFFPTDAQPVMRGSPLTLAERDDRGIVCYLDEQGIVCFDGWITTIVSHDDRVLAALPEN